MIAGDPGAIGTAVFRCTTCNALVLKEHMKLHRDGPVVRQYHEVPCPLPEGALYKTPLLEMCEGTFEFYGYYRPQLEQETT